MPRRNSGPRLRWIERRKSYYIVWYEKGRERLRSTGEADKRRAEAHLAGFIRATQRPVNGPRPAHEVKISEVLDYYGQKKGRFTKAPERIAYAIDALLPFWKDKYVSEVTDDECAAYIDWRKRADGTMRRELGTLQAAINYAHGRICEDYRPVMLPSKPLGKDRWLTRNEVARLLNAARTARADVRLYLPLFILLGVYGGQRKEAILTLRWPQVDLVNGRINYKRQGETNKRRAHNRIPRQLLGHLRRAHARRDSDLGFVIHNNGEPIIDIGGAWNGTEEQAVQGSFGRACKRAGVVDAPPHALRHTCGTWMAQAAVPMEKIGEYLGHTDERTTRLYAHHHPDYQDEAVAAFGRR